MSGFGYDASGILCIDGYDIREIASTHETPFYLYSQAQLEANFRALDELLAAKLGQRERLIAFSVKSCSVQGVLEVLRGLGAGADCVSIGEVYRAVKAGIKPENIVFAGVGKTEFELNEAIKIGVGQINVESFEELELLNRLAKATCKRQNYAVRINPNIEANTHKHITTGNYENKFGIIYEEFIKHIHKIRECDSLNLIGLSIHIGSQISEIEPLKAAFDKLVGLSSELILDGFDLKTIDFGGGLGVKYKEGQGALISKEIYTDEIAKSLDKLSQSVKLILEPGRFIACNSAVLVSKILYIKKTPYKNFLILDSGMNDLMRPSLYGAYHDIIPLVRSGTQDKFDVVGPVCETTCTFGEGRVMGAVKQGDFVAILNAGAYGAVMANNYNTRLKPAQIMLNKGEVRVLKKRETYEDIIE
jgi:diaminopimelate decarboxylase